MLRDTRLESFTMSEAQFELQLKRMLPPVIECKYATDGSGEVFYHLILEVLESSVLRGYRGYLVETRTVTKTIKNMPGGDFDLPFIHRGHKARVFKTMDAAHSALRQIGFKPITFTATLI